MPSMEMTEPDKSKVVLVDENDNEVGTEDKLKAHLGDGKLHRAITVLIFDESNKILITQRSSKKLLWPLYWESSCSTHPYPGESYEECAKRRIKEELNITDIKDLKLITKFLYKEKYKDIGTEYELCALLTCKTTQPPKPLPEEVSAFEFLSLEEIKSEIKNRKRPFAPWFILAIERIQQNF